MYQLTKEQLLRDLHEAYLRVKEGKSSKSYVIEFENYLEKNLVELCEALWNL